LADGLHAAAARAERPRPREGGGEAERLRQAQQGAGHAGQGVTAEENEPQRTRGHRERQGKSAAILECGDSSPLSLGQDTRQKKAAPKRRTPKLLCVLCDLCGSPFRGMSMTAAEITSALQERFGDKVKPGEALDPFVVVAPGDLLEVCR